MIYLHIGGPHHPSRSRVRSVSGSGSIPEGLRDRRSSIFPRLQRLQQLDDLVYLALPDVIDTHRPQTDVIIQKEVEQTEKTVQLVIVRSGRE